eukprot:749821-Hanusia_phi.AAC.15
MVAAPTRPTSGTWSATDKHALSTKASALRAHQRYCKSDRGRGRLGLRSAGEYRNTAHPVAVPVAVSLLASARQADRIGSWEADRREKFKLPYTSGLPDFSRLVEDKETWSIKSTQCAFPSSRPSTCPHSSSLSLRTW